MSDNGDNRTLPRGIEAPVPNRVSALDSWRLRPEMKISQIETVTRDLGILNTEVGPT